VVKRYKGEVKMSMTTHVIGIVPADEKWLKMKEVWDVCRAAGFDPPDEVYDFFEGQDPDDKGMAVEIPHEEWAADMDQGVEIEVANIPDKVKIIRFYNSW